MTVINASGLSEKEINCQLRGSDKMYRVIGCCGQRFLGAGMKEPNITIEGIPGNALGAYLDGASIFVQGNAQDAVGDTMNQGTIVVHGSIGDAAGYAMRGGCLYVKGDAGYRAGIHMKAYGHKVPVMIIGGKAGSFLGEYQAGGIIAVLGLTSSNGNLVGHFPCAGMHGGKVFLRGNWEAIPFPPQVTARKASQEDLEELRPYLLEFSRLFGVEKTLLLESPYTIVTPDSKNPYHQMYVAN